MPLNHRSKKTIAAFTLAVAAPFMGASSAHAAGEPIKDFVLRIHHNLYIATYNDFVNKFNSTLSLHEQALQTKNPATIADTQAIMNEANPLARACRATLPESIKAFNTRNQRERPLANPAELKKFEAAMAPFYTHCNAGLLPNVKVTSSGKIIADLKFNPAELEKQRVAALQKFAGHVIAKLDRYEFSLRHWGGLTAEFDKKHYYESKQKFEECKQLGQTYQAVLKEGIPSKIRLLKTDFEYRCTIL